MMNTKEYLEASSRTADREQYHDVANRFMDNCSLKADLLHAAIGLSTESGEFNDSIKRHLFYGKDLDVVNLKEEIGDVCWYIALALRALDSSFEEVMSANINKLKARFPDKFNYDQVINRDLENERKVLESDLL